MSVGPNYSISVNIDFHYVKNHQNTLIISNKKRQIQNMGEQKQMHRNQIYNPELA